MRYKTIALITLAVILLLGVSACAGGGGRAASSWPGLTADAEIAYLAYNKHIYAINISNGLEKWRYPAEASNNLAFYATPVLTEDGQLLAGDFANALHSLNSTTGQENWTFTQATDRYIGSPLVKAGDIFAPNAGNDLFALNANGSLRWEYETGGPLWAAPISETECDCVYVPSMDHSLYALNTQSGSLEWQSDELGGSIVSTPAISPDGATLYVSTFGNQVLAIRSQDGTIIWKTPTNDYAWGSPVLAGDQIYLTDQSGMVYSVNKDTGSIVWQVQLDGDIISSPLVTDDTIYVGTETGNFYALGMDGSTRWTRQFSGKLYTTPVKSGELILLASTGSDELLYALDVNGNPAWTFTPVSN